MLTDHVSVTFEHFDGLPRDRVVNTFTFHNGGSAFADADLAEIEARIQAFYNSVPTGGSHALAFYMSGALSRAVKPVIRHYNLDGHLDGSAHGSPVRVTDWGSNLGAVGGTQLLPGECAAVCTFVADFTGVPEFAPGARPRAHFRGRIYLGPLTNAALSVSSNRAILDPTFVQDLGKSALELVGAGDPTLQVWSRKTAATHDVVSVEVDDAFDTQRRRGERAISRVVFT
jgi:hypothetical protein